VFWPFETMARGPQRKYVFHLAHSVIRRNP
jgi:hypothetical protein